MAFDSTAFSLLKTYVMMIGEYEFEGIFTEHDDPNASNATNAETAQNLPFPSYSAFVFIAFVLVMSIIIMNLMVGLAVDDIAEIQANAEVQKLSLNVSNLFCHLDSFLCLFYMILILILSLTLNLITTQSVIGLSYHFHHYLVKPTTPDDPSAGI